MLEMLDNGASREELYEYLKIESRKYADREARRNIRRCMSSTELNGEYNYDGKVFTFFRYKMGELALPDLTDTNIARMFLLSTYLGKSNPHSLPGAWDKADKLLRLKLPIARRTLNILKKQDILDDEWNIRSCLYYGTRAEPITEGEAVIRIKQVAFRKLYYNTPPNALPVLGKALRLIPYISYSNNVLSVDGQDVTADGYSLDAEGLGKIFGVSRLCGYKLIQRMLELKDSDGEPLIKYGRIEHSKRKVIMFNPLFICGNKHYKQTKEIFDNMVIKGGKPSDN